MKRFLCVLLSCVIMAGCLPAQTHAANAPGKNIICLEDMEWERIDLSTVELWDEGIAPQTTYSVNRTISAHSIGSVVSSRFFEARSIITFNCSYSPSSASMDFGVLTPDGRFYFINVKGGSINQTLEISQAGNYSVAIRNNSSQTVSVVGFVEY